MGLHWCTEFPWALVPMVHPIRYPMELTIWERPMGKSHGKLDASRRKHDAPMGNLVGNPMGSPVGTKIHLMSSLMGPVAPPWKFYGKLDASHGTFHGRMESPRCIPREVPLAWDFLRDLQWEVPRDVTSFIERPTGSPTTIHPIGSPVGSHGTSNRVPWYI